MNVWDNPNTEPQEEFGLEKLPTTPVTACPTCWLIGPCDCGEY